MLRPADPDPVLSGADAGMARAYATLLRGADFLANGLRTPSANSLKTASSPIHGRCRARVIGNALRELDRFLNLIADEAAHFTGSPPAPGQRNTANKLRDAAMLRLSCRDYARLRALGRSRECLFHCNGQVTHGDVRGDPIMTAGWPESDHLDAPLRRVSVGDELVVTANDLAEICGFYRLLATRLVEAVSRPAASGRR